VKIESSFDFWLYLINPSFDFFETSDFFGMRGAKFKSQLHRTKKNCSLVIKPHTLKNNSSENVARERQRERGGDKIPVQNKKKNYATATHTHTRALREARKKFPRVYVCVMLLLPCCCFCYFRYLQVPFSPKNSTSSIQKGLVRKSGPQILARSVVVVVVAEVRYGRTKVQETRTKQARTNRSLAD